MTSPQSPRVAFLGLGTMGAQMAAHVARKGFPLTVFNRTAEKAKPLAALGARVAPDIASAVRDADIVVTMLSDDAAIESVMTAPRGILDGVRPGTLIIDSSTVTPGLARRMSERSTERGCVHVDAPVVGSAGAARDAQLVVVAGGPAEAFARAHAIFETYGQRIIHAGPAGAGAVVKLVANMLNATLVAALAEAELVAEAAGADMSVVRELLFEGSVGCGLLKRKLPKMQERDFSAEFAIALMHKDVSYFVRLANESGHPGIVAPLVGELFRGAVSAGWGSADTAAMFGYLGGTRAP